MVYRFISLFTRSSTSQLVQHCHQQCQPEELQPGLREPQVNELWRARNLVIEIYMTYVPILRYHPSTWKRRREENTTYWHDSCLKYTYAIPKPPPNKDTLHLFNLPWPTVTGNAFAKRRSLPPLTNMCSPRRASHLNSKFQSNSVGILWPAKSMFPS